MRLARVVCPTLAITVASIVGGCRHTSKSTDVKEAPDSSGAATLLGIDPPYTWDSVKDATSGQIQVPWSDTYWPLAARGLAARWAAGDKISALPASPQSFAEALVTLRETLASTDPLATAYLSPAEKYDIVAGRIEAADAGFWRDLEALKASFGADVGPQLDALTTKNKELHREISGLNEQIDELGRQASETISRLQAGSEADRQRVDETIKRYAEQINAVAVRLGELLNTYKANQRTMRTLRTPFTTKEMAFASKALPLTPMTAASWSTWGGWEVSDVDNYLWMGHCHGWALASVVEDAPKHAVMVHQGDRKVLFTEGDIRGLVTKIWADQLPPTKFAATRCNSKDPPKIAGRISDGMVCIGVGCEAEKGKHIHIKNNRFREGFIEYSSSPFDPHTKFAKFQGALTDDRVAVVIYESAAAMSKDLFAPDATVTKQFGSLHLGAGCRDVNPMTLHLALTKLIHDRKVGFVIDRDRNAEVWNQPVQGYELEYLPIKTRTGEAPGGVPVDIGSVSDPLGPFRAPGTAFLVSIQATITFGVEIEPQLTYASNASDERTGRMVVTYTLELDKNKNIIGGEWGRLPRDKGGSFEPIESVPDFIWYAAKGTTPNPGLYDVGLVKKIQACAAAPATGKVVLKRQGATGDIKDEELAYSDCSV
ncbi:MAG: hypothetical protein FJ146_08505 [Deltaproteobacteria bacterium]|nr:hypothetical protein [Deltaproteobacteria bacterium]